MDSKLARWCESLIEAGWLTAVIVIPLFFNIHSERVFEPDKLTLLRSIALLMVAAWLGRFIDQQGWRDRGWLRWRGENGIWQRPFVLPILALVLIYLVATLFSVTPRVSWAGSYQRLQGTYTTLAYVVIFALMAHTIQTREQVRRVVTAVIITSIPIAFYGLLQHFDLDPLPWGGNVTSRVAGHMGNAIFIAAYLIMAVPLTLGRIIDAFTNILSDEKLSNADIIRSSIYIFALSIQLITIYWSGSRGPQIGLAAGLFSFTLVLLVSLRNATPNRGSFRLADSLPAFLFITPTLLTLLFSQSIIQATSPLAAFGIFMGATAVSVLLVFVLLAARRGWNWLWLGWILLTVLLAGWLVAFNIPPTLTAPYQNSPVIGSVVRSLDAWRELPTVGSYGRMLDPTQNVGREKSNRVRVLIWQGVIDLIQPHEPLQFPDGRSDPFNFLRPLIGYGPEAMYVAYNPFYPPELATVEARNASPDRSHNETFDALVITGLFGFLVWQALYLSVFYVGFRYLGVVKTARDRTMLAGGWVGGALLGALVSIFVFDPVYLGVAIPSGSIVGLVGYLIYYALVARSGAAVADPFQVDRLLVNSLVGAVLAHFVEIHFGIAIAATRVHFFVYVAIIYLIGYKLPRLQQAPVVEEETAVALAKGRRRRAERPVPTSSKPGWLAPVLLAVLMLALILGTLGFEFMTYSLPPDKLIQSRTDLTAAEIFYQSLFINARRGFVDSPFIFLMMMFTWLLGGLVVLSEMVKHEELPLLTAVDPTAAPKLAPNRQQLAGLVLLLLAGVALALRFVLPLPQPFSTTAMLGRTLGLVWAILCAFAAYRLFTNHPSSRLTAGLVALVGLLTAVPIMIAGGVVYGLATAVICAALLYLLWDNSWNKIMLPPALLGFGPLAIGLVMGYFQAARLRSSLLLQSPTPLETLDQILQFRVFEANRAAGFLTLYYIFFTLLIFAAAYALAVTGLGRRRRWGSTPALVTLAGLLIVCFMLIAQSNMRVVQADMIYKRGKPFDNKATSESNPDAWDTAIAVYKRAIELVPNEDFYYLFLGRAVLERSTITVDAAERNKLLTEAQNRLLQAQSINPLNTDHTANLARLNTRWFQLAPDAADRQVRLAAAEQYYQQALQLSPQNSVIRNEYAQLAFDLKHDCDETLDLYQQSLAIDPFYSATYFALSDAYLACAGQEPAGQEPAGQEPAGEEPSEQQTAYYEAAAAYLEEGLARDADNPRTWLKAAQIYQGLGRYDEALAAYDEVRRRNATGQIPAWNLDYWQATVYLSMGDTEKARELALQAQAAAPNSAEVQQLLEELD